MAERLYNQSLQRFEMTVPAAGGRRMQTFDISPNAENLVVKMPSGNIIEIPRNANIPQGAQVLNKTVDELRTMIPAEIRPAAQQTTSVPSAGSRPIQPPPEPSRLSTSPFGPRPAPPTREPDLGLPLGAAGLAGTGGILAAQRGDIYSGGQRYPTQYLDADDDRAANPLDPALVQRENLRNLPAYRGPAVDVMRSPLDPAREQMIALQNMPAYSGPPVDEVRSPPEPESRDVYPEFGRGAPNYMGSIGPAGSLPMMARRGGGEGQYTGIIDPSILMIARDRLMPYSMRREEGAASAAPAISTPAGRSGSAGPRAASSTSTAAAPAGGFLSGLFKDPYEGKSSRDLYGEYQKRQMSGDDDPAMYVRAARREMEERGRARGGSAEGSKHQKDAAVMKALEIIHHMLSNR
jgi:hypothetical protein